MAEGVSLSEHPIKLVAVDLDGTLLTSAKQVSEKTVRALRCLPSARAGAAKKWGIR
jgi:hypothetical protein